MLYNGVRGLMGRPQKAITMKWKKRLEELAKLKAKHGKDRSKARPFPDLSVEKRTAPTSDRVQPPAILTPSQVKDILGPGFDIKFTSKGYKVEEG